MALGLAGCGSGGGTTSPAGGGGTNNNPIQTDTYLPVTVGSTWTYNRSDGSTQTQTITANSNNQVTQVINDTTLGKSVDILNISNGAFYLGSITKYDAAGNVTSTKTYTPAPGQLAFPSSTTAGTHEAQTVQINTQPANTTSSHSLLI